MYLGQLRRLGVTYTHYCVYKDLLYSTGNYTQYFVITYKGRESEEDFIYIYTHTYVNVCVRHSIVSDSLDYRFSRQEYWSCYRKGDPFQGLV